MRTVVLLLLLLLMAAGCTAPADGEQDGEGAEGPGVAGRGAENSGAQDPGVEDPGVEDPGVEDPGVAGRQMVGGPAIVAFGDSVPAGTACGCAPFPDLYAQRLPGGTRTINLASDGFTSADVLNQVRSPDGEDAVRAATEVLIMVGANDAADEFPGRDAATYAEIAGQVTSNVTDAVRAIHAVAGEGLPVVVLGYWNVVQDGVGAGYAPGEDAEAALATSDTNHALAAAADATGALFVPTYPLFKGVDGGTDPTPLLTEDGDHPNATGHELIADAIPRQ